MKLISLHKDYSALLAKASQQNRKAQHELFQLFAPKMLSVCRQYIKQKEIAEEVMLAGFLKVFTHINDFKNEGSFEGWVRRIMVNQSLSKLRAEKKLVFHDEGFLENSLEHSVTIDSEFDVAQIQKLIDALPEGYKTVFMLYAVEGYKHSEIAEQLQISESTSKSQLFKARKQLQALINKQERQYGTH